MAGKSKKDDAHERAVEEAREQIRAELRGESGGKTGKSGKTSKSSKYGYGGGYARSRNGKLIPFILGIVAGYIFAFILTFFGYKFGNDELMVVNVAALIFSKNIYMCKATGYGLLDSKIKRSIQ